MKSGRKGTNKTAADQVVEETKVNVAKVVGKSKSRSPGPSKKGGKFESAPEQLVQVRGRTK